MVLRQWRILPAPGRVLQCVLHLCGRLRRSYLNVAESYARTLLHQLALRSYLPLPFIYSDFLDASSTHHTPGLCNSFTRLRCFATAYLSWFGDQSNCALETQNPVEISCKSTGALTPGVATSRAYPFPQDLPTL